MPVSLPLYATTVSTSNSPSFSFRPGRDILSGRGESIKVNNSFYIQMIHAYSPVYVSCPQTLAKRDVALQVIDRVHQNEGRFLDKNGMELPLHQTVVKVKKALKDRGLKMRKLNSQTELSPIPVLTISAPPHKLPDTISSGITVPPSSVKSAFRLNRSRTMLTGPVDPALAVQLNLEPRPLQGPLLHSCYFEPLPMEAPPNDPIWQDTLQCLNRLSDEPSTLA
jgi:hypothetical protein